MQHLLLIYLNQERWAALSTDERNRIHEDCGAWHQELVKSGHAVSATGLQPKTTARTLREAGGKAVVTDGPFAETTEVLGGFELIDCRDIAEAQEIAARFPGLRVGSAVEIRPLMTGPCRA